MKVFYHGDLDGQCSGAIVNKYYSERGVKPEFYEAKYGMKLDSIPIEKDEPVIIVDFSFQLPSQFEDLLKITKNIIWIDHHKTALADYNTLKLDGLRRVGTAGCELTWEFYYPGIPVPDVAKYIGDMDEWKWLLPKTEGVIEGLQLYDVSPTSNDWIAFLTRGFDLQPIYEMGLTCIKWRSSYYSRVVGNAYEVDFKGYRAIACNCSYTGSLVFRSVPNRADYDMMICYYHNKNGYSVSLYCDNKRVKCGDIAKTYGGGGHDGAAGFQCKELPFSPKLSIDK